MHELINSPSYDFLKLITFSCDYHPPFTDPTHNIPPLIIYYMDSHLPLFFLQTLLYGNYNLLWTHDLLLLIVLQVSGISERV